MSRHTRSIARLTPSASRTLRSRTLQQGICRTARGLSRRDRRCTWFGALLSQRTGQVAHPRVFGRYPIAVQLRFLQTMREVASERNTTTFFPIPIDLFTPLMRGAGAPDPSKP